MTFNNIQEICGWVFVGNYASDSSAFGAIDKFVQDTSNSTRDRAESLRVMSDRGMGCGRELHLSDTAMVSMYMDSM